MAYRLFDTKLLQKLIMTKHLNDTKQNIKYYLDYSYIFLQLII